MGIGGRAVGRWRLIGDVPFEFESEVARASAVAEASHVESSAAAARHDVKLQREMLMQSGGGRSRAAVEMEVVEREQSNRRKRKEPRLVRVARDSRRHFETSSRGCSTATARRLILRTKAPVKWDRRCEIP